MIIGDAAHTGPPDGMGLNMAWEDVAVLADSVRRHGITEQVCGCVWLCVRGVGG